MSGKNVPELRFPGFEGEWDSIRAGDEFDFRNGLNFTRGSTGQDVKVVGVGEFQAKTDFDDTSTLSPIRIQGQLDDRDLLKKNDLLFVRSNGNKALIGRCLRIGKLDERVSFSGFTIRARPSSEKLSPAYSGLPFRSYRYKRYLDETGGGSSISNLNQGILAGFEFRAPSILEQQKIAAFLGAVDEKISGLERKQALLEAYKRGVMQKLFSRALRFKDDQGRDFPDWEEKRLGELANKVSTKNTNDAHSRVLTNSAVRGVVDQGDYFDHDVANAANLGGYYVVEKGDFVYNPRISVTAPVGPIKRNDLEVGLMSPLYSVFRFHDPNTDFWVHYFDSVTWHRYMKMVANYGARHDRMAISVGDFMNMPLPLPCDRERAKIVGFLSSLNDRITSIKDEITQAKTFKKGLLQQMFV